MGGLPLLAHLGLAHCPAVSGDLAVLGSCPGLRYLALTQCARIRGDLASLAGLAALEVPPPCNGSIVTALL